MSRRMHVLMRVCTALALVMGKHAADIIMLVQSRLVVVAQRHACASVGGEPLLPTTAPLGTRFLQSALSRSTMQLVSLPGSAAAPPTHTH